MPGCHITLKQIHVINLVSAGSLFYWQHGTGNEEIVQASLQNIHTFHSNKIVS